MKFKDTLVKNSILNPSIKFVLSPYRKLKRSFKSRQIENMLANKFSQRSIHYFNKNLECYIAELCDKYGSDKGELNNKLHTHDWPSHTYNEFYSRTFSHCRLQVKKVFECGIGTNNETIPSSMGASGRPGASLRVWKEYFPNATIFGADIDKQVLFQEERIVTSYLDQLKPATIVEFWQHHATFDFDLMIDDGLHTLEAGLNLFTYSIDRLANNGIYVIEDVGTKDMMSYYSFFDKTDFLVEYICMYNDKHHFEGNNLIVIRKK